MLQDQDRLIRNALIIDMYFGVFLGVFRHVFCTPEKGAKSGFEALLNIDFTDVQYIFKHFLMSDLAKSSSNPAWFLTQI